MRDPKTGTGLSLKGMGVFWIIYQDNKDNNCPGNYHQDALAVRADKSKACGVFDGMICIH
jgi:hypothetical protein